MAQTIVVYSQSFNKAAVRESPGASLSMQTTILSCLNEKQARFVRQYTWRAEFNWHNSQTELVIRKSEFTAQEWTQILFLFPHAHLRRGPLR